VRQSLRELASAFPRLRAVVEPTALSYALRILPDDAVVDQLFADSYRVATDVDLDSRAGMEAFHTAFINEPIALERGLPWRARFVPHASQPALMFSMHHIMGDGRSMVMLMCAIMNRLNGQAIPPCQIDSPSMLPATMPLKWWQWPASIARFWQNSRADKAARQGLNIVTLARRPSTRYTTSTVRYHELPCPADVMKAQAKQLGTTVNTLLTAIMANAFLALAPGDKQAAAALRISVDLRRYFPEGTAPEFGNFVSSFTVLARPQATLAAQIASLEGQIKAHLARYERRDYAVQLRFYEWLPLMGRTLYSHLIVKSKAKGTLPNLSCHLSNLGSAEFINPKGAQIRLQEVWPTTISTVLLIGALSFNGKQFLTLISQNDEIPPEAIGELLTQLDQQFHQLMAAAPSP
jgi:NRPS condensation-like uncharacterized protein